MRISTLTPNSRVVLLGLTLCVSPAVFAGALRPDLASLPAVPSLMLPPAQVDKALELAPRKNVPFEYAVGVRTGYALGHGLWDTLADGSLRWRMRLNSPGAHSLSLHLAPLRLPPSAALWIYAEDGSLLHGPYRAANVTALGLWTPIVPHDRLVIEARVAAAEAAQLQLGVADAYHGYRDWKDTGSDAKSGSCNIDVACPRDGVWNNQMRSVARIQVGGTILCSGQLVNNTNQDLDPLFLTADHCGIEDAGSPAASVVFYWNYQASACDGARDGSLSQTQSGSTFLADGYESDFTLVRLLAAPDTAYNVYFSGWNVSGSGSDCGVAIHHPNADEKAISFFSRALQATDADIDGRNVHAWQVQWAAGTTEQGSSGGGLWNNRHELVGVLSGGEASCSNRNGPDFFARLDEAWNPPSSASDHQLKAWLDPDSRLGPNQLWMPGRDPDQPAAPLNSVSSTACGSPGGTTVGGKHRGGALLPLLLAPLLLGALRFRIRA